MSRKKFGSHTTQLGSVAVALTLVLGAALAVSADQSSPGTAAPEVSVVMQDGSVLIGHFQVTKVEITTKYRTQEMTATDIVGFGDGQFVLSDGTKLKGRIGTERITLVTLHGDIGLPSAEIKTIDVKNPTIAPNGSGAAQISPAATQPVAATANAPNGLYEQPAWKQLQGAWACMHLVGSRPWEAIVTLTLGGDGSVDLTEKCEIFSGGKKQYTGKWKLDEANYLVVEFAPGNNVRPPVRGKPTVDRSWLHLSYDDGSATDTFVRVGADGVPLEPPPQDGLTILDGEAVLTAYMRFASHCSISPQFHGAYGASLATSLVQTVFGTYVLQCHNVYYRVGTIRIEEADRLNGVEWKGRVSFYAAATRTLGKPKGARSWKQGTWANWTTRDSPIWNYDLTKRKDRGWEVAFGGGPEPLYEEGSVAPISEDALPPSGSGGGNAGQSITQPGSGAPPSTPSLTRATTAPDATDPSQAFKDRLARPGAPPTQPDLTYANTTSGVTVQYPADFQTGKRRGAVVFFGSPWTGDSNKPPVEIVVSYNTLPPGRQMDLDQLYHNTIAPIQHIDPNATCSDPVRTTLAGTDAYGFTMDYQVRGRKMRDAAIISLRQGKVLGVVFNATPQTFDQYWDDFKRVCDSCQVQ